MKKDVKSTKDLIGIKEILSSSVKTEHSEIVFFMIYPTNLSVLSSESINSKVYCLMNVIRSFPNIEMICINSKENFDNNKKYLRNRINEEENHIIRNLIIKDLISLDEMQEIGSAREFLIAIKLRNNTEKDESSYLLQFEKLVKEQGFRVKKASKSDIKRILSAYFEQNVTTEKFEDYDGDRWVIFGDN